MWLVVVAGTQTENTPIILDLVQHFSGESYIYYVM